MVKRLATANIKKEDERDTARGYKPKCLREVLGAMSYEPDSKKFFDLFEQVNDEHRRELVLERCGYTREAGVQRTPRIVKDLRPQRHGCYLVWQTSASIAAFEGYYPLKPEELAKQKANKKGRKKTHVTKSRSYGGKYTQFQALKHVVDALWTLHGKEGYDSGRRYRTGF